MAPTYKLTYFNMRGRAETSRLVFAYAGVDYEDNRIEAEDWPKLKPNCPWETLPVLEFDGHVISQSVAILRFLGKKFKLAGTNEIEEAKCDEMTEAMAELINACQPAMMEQDEDKKKELVKNLVTEKFPKYLSKWNEIIENNGGFLVGKQLTYADIFIAGTLQIYQENLGEDTSNLLEDYPALSTHQQQIVFNAPGIKEWIEKRPKTLR